MCDKGLVGWPCSLLDRRSRFVSVQCAECHKLLEDAQMVAMHIVQSTPGRCTSTQVRIVINNTLPIQHDHRGPRTWACGSKGFKGVI